MNSEDLKLKIYNVLIEVGKSLSSIQIYRNLIRANQINTRENMKWTTISEVIKKNIKKNKEDVLFYEEKQGIFGLKKWEIEKQKNEIFFPNTLILFQKEYIIIKDKTCNFIPELSCYFRYVDPNERQEYFNTESYLLRRRKRILNLNNIPKKRKYVDLIKNNLELIQDNEAEINLILDLNQNTIYYKKNVSSIDQVLNLPFEDYKVNPLEEDMFLDKIDFYLKEFCS